MDMRTCILGHHGFCSETLSQTSQKMNAIKYYVSVSTTEQTRWYCRVKYIDWYSVKEIGGLGGKDIQNLI